MNKITHETIPLIALANMPADFREYMKPLGEDGIRHWADAPDEIDRSNIDARISDLSHSYKLTIKDMASRQVSYTRGSAINRIVSAMQDARDGYLEGQHDMARYHLAKGTHFVVDSITLPHLQSGKASNAMHQRFEDDIGREVERFRDLRVTPQAYKEKPYKEHRNRAIAALFDFYPLLDLYAQGGSVRNDSKMLWEIVTRCTQTVADWWTTLFVELKRR